MKWQKINIAMGKVEKYKKLSEILLKKFIVGEVNMKIMVLKINSLQMMNTDIIYIKVLVGEKM